MFDDGLDVEPRDENGAFDAAEGARRLRAVAATRQAVSTRHGVDLRFGKVFRYNNTRTMVALDVFNVANSNTTDVYVQNYGPNYLAPVSVTSARLFKISAQFDF